MRSSEREINKRYNSILNTLQEKGQQSTAELSEHLCVSISTIRRDLIVLEQKNEIIRQHGYCTYNYHNKIDFDETGPERLKELIGQEAGKLIHPYDTVFINTSSTALNAIKSSKATHLTVVSNNLKLSSINLNPHSSYLLTGGEMRFPKESLVGDIALRTIQEINADTCIIGCSGVDLVHGVTTKVLNEAKLNEAMIQKTIKNRILVADHRKIGNISQFKISDLSMFNYVITDQYSPKSWIKQVKKQGLNVIVVKPF